MAAYKMSIKKPYGPKTKIYNWLDIYCEQQENLKRFKGTIEEGALLVEKTRQVFDSFHDRVELDPSSTKIPFGGIVQLQPYYIPSYRNAGGIRPALSVVINENVLQKRPYFNEQCEVTVAPSYVTNMRNSFRITSPDENPRINETLKFGQVFRLESLGAPNNLYLYSTPRNADLSFQVPTQYETRKFGDLNLAVGLGSRTDFESGGGFPFAFANWTCLTIFNNDRFESEGKMIVSNTPLLIKHMITRKNLAVDNILTQTIFGKEYLVSAQNYEDQYRRPQWQNIWSFCNGHRTQYD